VGFDPLDGSSIVDANFAVGKLFAVVDVSWCSSQQTKDLH
jgi:fructose-1,6-bisphosphatase